MLARRPGRLADRRQEVAVTEVEAEEARVEEALSELESRAKRSLFQKRSMARGSRARPEMLIRLTGSQVLEEERESQTKRREVTEEETGELDRTLLTREDSWKMACQKEISQPNLQLLQPRLLQQISPRSKSQRSQRSSKKKSSSVSALTIS